MKNSILYSLVASISMFSIGAYATDPVADADSSALTTKGYVDAGLKYVYDTAKGDIDTVQGDITLLQNTVGAPANGANPATGLVKDVADLQNAVGDSSDGLVKDVTDLKNTVGDSSSGLVKRVNDLESSSIVYTEGDGIKVTQGATASDPSTIGLDINNAQNNTTYVFKTDSNGNGTWQAMEVENTWNPAFLTTP